MRDGYISEDRIIHLQWGRPGFDPWVGKIPWRRERLPTPVFWPGESHGCIVHGVTKSQTWLSNFDFVCVLSHLVLSSSLWLQGLWPTRLLCPWGFSKQEYWSGLPCPPPEDLPNPGIEPRFPVLQVILYHLSHHGSPLRTLMSTYLNLGTWIKRME